ncbi:MAG: VanZ family protein [Clostridia bacterium]|nr:VanZ family protein [Clostridia bacterium]
MTQIESFGSLFGMGMTLETHRAWSRDTTLLLAFAAFVIAPLGAYLFSKLLKGRFPWVRLAIVLLFILFIAFETVIGRPPLRRYRPTFTPFASYANLQKKTIQRQILCNIMVFVPLGFLLNWGTGLSFLKTVLLCLLISLSIEFTQLMLKVGYCETDDLIHNTLGSIIGYWYFELLAYIKRRLFDTGAKTG